jgi:hypothetical protein
MDIGLKLAAEAYRCDPCTRKQGVVVRELVRMMPMSVVLNGRIVGEEFYCCPICFEPKFNVKSGKKVGKPSINRGASAKGPRIADRVE